MCIHRQTHVGRGLFTIPSCIHWHAGWQTRCSISTVIGNFLLKYVLNKMVFQLKADNMQNVCLVMCIRPWPQSHDLDIQKSGYSEHFDALKMYLRIKNEFSQLRHSKIKAWTGHTQFCSCDLDDDLDAISWVDILNMHPHTKNEVYMPRLSKVEEAEQGRCNWTHYQFTMGGKHHNYEEHTDIFVRYVRCTQV